MHYILISQSLPLAKPLSFQNNSIQELFQFFQNDIKMSLFFHYFVALFIVISMLLGDIMNELRTNKIVRLVKRIFKISIWVINGISDVEVMTTTQAFQVNIWHR